MSRISINSKLALQGFVVLADAVYNTKCIDEQLGRKFLPKTLEVFGRFGISTKALSKVIEQAYNGYYVCDDLLKQLNKDINTFLTLVKQDEDAHPSVIELYSHVKGSFLGTNSQYAHLRNKTGLLTNKELSSLFTFSFSASEQKEAIAFIENYKDIELSKLKEEKPTEYKQLLQAKKLVKETFTYAIKSYVQNNEPIVDYDKVLTYLKANSISHSLPIGYKGYIDEFCNLYTTKKVKLSSTPYNCVVKMNPTYNPDKDDTYVCSARSEKAKNDTFIYSESYKAAARTKKFKVVKDLKKTINSLRKQWLNCLDYKHKNYQEAIILELIYQTQARIGNKNNATIDKQTQKARKTYGISTIRAKHFYFIGNDLHFKYPGKAAFKGDIIHYQEHVVQPISDELSFIIAWFKQLKLEPSQAVFTTTDAKVRSFLKSLNPPDGVTIHKLRTLKGTIMMQERIKNHPFIGTKNSTAKVSKWLKEEALEVGKQLGHMSGEKYTATTAIAHYIDPATMMKLYREAKVLPPKPMLRLVGITEDNI